MDWGGGFDSTSTRDMPVTCFYSSSGMNRLTFAFSDVLNATMVKSGIHEESGEVICSIGIFTQPTPAMKTYEATLRIDTRNITYHDALEQVQQWWTAMKNCTPARVPDIARLPMYSTWYSFHQEVSPASVEKQCKMAKELGCESVIVDDGWQTTDNSRGYAFCGDWEAVRMPEMRKHVDRVHRLGMKYILWYSVPFVGKQTKTWAKFENKMLYYRESANAGLLDPRFPEVREHLIDVYERAMREWDLDGFKLDFVDSFDPPENEGDVRGTGRDFVSVAEACDRLLNDVIARLRLIKPDVMVEFRQEYIGPLMRKYGNMFRAGDCANDFNTNRIRILDLRLTSGNTAVHSDMIMWHPDDPVASAAMQFIHILFSVPQISVLLDKIPKDHLEMLRFWLRLWRDNRDVFLDGKIEPMYPELTYPLVISSTRDKRVVAVYGNVVANPGRNIPRELMLVNGSFKDRIVLELGENMGNANINICDCCGRVMRNENVTLTPGLHSIAIPSAGVAWLRR